MLRTVPPTPHPFATVSPCSRQALSQRIKRQDVRDTMCSYVLDGNGKSQKTIRLVSHRCSWQCCSGQQIAQSREVDENKLCVDWLVRSNVCVPMHKVFWPAAFAGLRSVNPDREAQIDWTDIVDFGDQMCGTRLQVSGRREHAISCCTIKRRSTSPFLRSQRKWWR